MCIHKLTKSPPRGEIGDDSGMLHLSTTRRVLISLLDGSSSPPTRSLILVRSPNRTCLPNILPIPSTLPIFPTFNLLHFFIYQRCWAVPRLYNSFVTGTHFRGKLTWSLYRESSWGSSKGDRGPGQSIATKIYSIIGRMPGDCFDQKVLPTSLCSRVITK